MKPKYVPSARQGFLLALGGLPIWIVLALAGQSARGEVAWILTLVFAMTVIARYELRRQKWFWIILVSLFLVQTSLIWWNPLQGEHVMGIVLALLAFVDYAIVYGVVALSEKLFGTPSFTNER
jgi:hypothetical protein